MYVHDKTSSFDAENSKFDRPKGKLPFLTRLTSSRKITMSHTISIIVKGTRFDAVSLSNQNYTSLPNFQKKY